ncbi:hypothetical protein PVK06_024509 [Gossypium arboreum]|uniref:Uncharacterized protein n=1 Tax=Gossypium arboreum TaxID=29729 RepID=A0ABR0PEC1_GOSAR|nr:hypothetical protein PVK06_024509 [Gossypium arboreum]
MKNQSRRDDYRLYENPSSHSQREVSHFDSFLYSSFCNKSEKTSEKEFERKKETKEKECERKQKENKKKKNQIEKEKEKEKEIEIEIESEKECEKKKQIEIKIESESSKGTSEKEREFKNELEKETNEKDDNEQGQVRNVSTNPHVSCPCAVSHFQVSEESCDKFPLQYFLDVRRFHLIEKDLFCDGKPVDVVRLDRQTRNIILHDNGFSRKAFKLFDCGDYVNPFMPFVTSLNLCKSVLLNIKSFDYLILYMYNSFWIGLFDLMTKMQPLLHFGLCKQTRVFKPRICYFGLICRELKHPKFCANNLCLLDAWTMTKEMKFKDFDYNLKSFLDHFMWLYVKFKFPLEKVSQGSCDELRLQYLSKKRRFVMTGKCKTNPCFHDPSVKQGMDSEISNISLFNLIDEESLPKKI